MDVSFIIPALNEEQNIEKTIDSIKNTVGGFFDYEILIIDNGSEDNTLSIAKKLGVKTIVKPTGTIGSLRNVGARVALGSLLVFIDADVTLDRNWGKIFQSIQAKITDSPIVSGSRCLSSNQTNFYTKYWFNYLRLNSSNDYIGTGHLILSRKLFELIDGFDENLKTGEDHDLCVRAKEAGAKIVPNIELEAYHHGFPENALDFIKREAWHGMSDSSSILKVVRSPIYLIAIVQVTLALMVLLGLSMGYIYFSIFCLITFTAIALTISNIKFKSLNPRERTFNAYILVIYLIGRFMSLLRVGGRFRS